MFEFEHASLSSSHSLRSSLCPSSSYVSPGDLETLWARSLFPGHVICIRGYASGLKPRSLAKLSLFFLSFFFSFFHYFSTSAGRIAPTSSFLPLHAGAAMSRSTLSLFLALASASYVFAQSLSSRRRPSLTSWSLLHMSSLSLCTFPATPLT